MGNYILGPNGELYHGIGDWFKKDAKYIKREWKNGRWNYTYPEDKKQNSNSRRTVSSKDNTTTSYTRNGMVVTVRDNTNRRSTNVNGQSANNNQRGGFSRLIDSAKQKIGDYVEGVKQDWEESKERGTENAEREAARRGQKLIDTDSALSSTSRRVVTRQIGNVKVNDILNSTYYRGKIDQYLDTAMEYVRDRLGYDERDAYVTARLRESAERVNAMRNDPGNSAGRTAHNDRAVATASEERRAAEDAYFNTPIGRLEKTYETGKEWLDKLFGRR